MAANDDDADESPIPADLFPEIGQSLFGVEWIAPLAQALGVSARNVRRWAGDPGAIPPGVWADASRLIDEERDRLFWLHVRALHVRARKLEGPADANPT